MTALPLRQVRSERQETDDRVQRLLPTPQSRLPVSSTPCLSSWGLSPTLGCHQPQWWELGCENLPGAEKIGFPDVFGFSSGARARLETRAARVGPPASLPRPTTRPAARPAASSLAAGEAGLWSGCSAPPGTRAPTSTRAEGLPSGGCAPRNARAPFARSRRRASAARRRARPPQSFTISRPRAPPSSPGIQTASRRRQPRILPPAPQPRSVHQYLEGRRDGRRAHQASKRLLIQPRHRPGALLPPAHRPTRRPSHRRRPLLSAFLASWPIRLLRGGGFGKTHLRSLSTSIFLFGVCGVSLQGASPRLSFEGFIHLDKAQGSGHWLPPTPRLLFFSFFPLCLSYACIIFSNHKS